MDLIWVKREAIYFLRGDWTTQITLIVQAFFALRRTPESSARTIKFGTNCSRRMGFVEIRSGYAPPGGVRQDDQAETMRLNRTSLLIILVVALNAVMAVVSNLRIAGYLTVETQFVVAYIAFGLNFAAAIAGLWTQFRLAWVSYLVLSVATVLLLSSMPLSAAWILTKLAARHAFA